MYFLLGLLFLNSCAELFLSPEDAYQKVKAKMEPKIEKMAIKASKEKFENEEYYTLSCLYSLPVGSKAKPNNFGIYNNEIIDQNSSNVNDYNKAKSKVRVIINKHEIFYSIVNFDIDYKNNIARITSIQKEEDSEFSCISKTDPLKKYRGNKKLISSIEKREIFIGMPEDALILSWGEPKNINSSQTGNIEFKQYVYENQNYVYLQNGKVVSWQEFN